MSIPFVYMGISVEANPRRSKSKKESNLEVNCVKVILKNMDFRLWYGDIVIIGLGLMWYYPQNLGTTSHKTIV
ncbi:hypothetical protein CR513_56581, partial [Mucuna pruriens]